MTVQGPSGSTTSGSTTSGSVSASDLPSPAGDIGGTYASMLVSKLQGTPYSISGLATGNYLRYNGTNWVNSSLLAADVQTALGTASSTTSGYLTSADWNTFNGAATASTNAASANTVSTIVKRDGSGNFSAGAITATGMETGTLKVTGGTPASGKALISDASGNATWQTLSGSTQWTTSGSDISFASGKVSIGTATAGQALTVNGRVETKGGMLFNQGSGLVDNLIYVGSTSSGKVDASFGFMVAGMGSGDHNDGPYFLGRGNTFSASPDQRGNMYFVAGYPTAPTVDEGSIKFMTGSNSPTRVKIDPLGRFQYFGPNSGIPAGEAGFDISAGHTPARIYGVNSGGITMPLNLMNFSTPAAIGSGTQLNFTMTSTNSTGELFSAITSIVTDEQGASASGDLYFSTRGNNSLTEKMRIKSNGRVGISNDSPSTLLHVGSAATTSGTTVATFENAGGTCSVTPNTAGAISCSSDERLKERIEQVSGASALDRLLQLQAKTYQFRSDRSGTRHTGYIAQELQKIAPEFVRKGEDGYLQVFYSGLIPWITEGIKELHRQFNARMNGVDDKIQKLEAEGLRLRAVNESQAEEIRALKSESAQLKEYLCAKDAQASLCGK